MSFARPDLLWFAAALPAVVVALVWAWHRRRRRVLERLGDARLLDRLGAAGLDRLPALRLALLAGAAAALGFAAAGPRWGVEGVEARGRSLQVVLAMDVSRSMLARDVEPNRLERERLLARRLLRGLQGDRIGLVAFAGRAYILSPLTVDQSAIQLYLDAVDPEIVSQGGSSIAAALRQATALLQGQREAGGDRAIILLTDGEALESEADVVAAARRAAGQRIIVHTVGIGTPGGSPVPEIDPVTREARGWKRDESGATVISRLNDALLREVADAAHGEYFALQNPASASRLLATLQRMERGNIEDQRRVVARERYTWFVALALLLLAIDTWAARRTPRPAVRSAAGELEVAA